MSDDDGVETECDHCGETKECEYRDDPYLAELYDESAGGSQD